MKINVQNKLIFIDHVYRGEIDTENDQPTMRVVLKSGSRVNRRLNTTSTDDADLKREVKRELNKIFYNKKGN